uniref:hypothetical protein n=1 Tax=Salmonella sp. TaxID=599 RepID=UPI001CD9A063|nr:hypothetical protein [Salmonella sp.]
MRWEKSIAGFGITGFPADKDNNQADRKMLAPSTELPAAVERPASDEPVKGKLFAKSASARNLADSLLIDEDIVLV